MKRFLVIVLIGCYQLAFAQFRGEIGAGFTSFWISGKNPAKETLAFLGGGFSGSQPGLQLSVKFPSGIAIPFLTEKQFDFVLRFSQYFFDGRERYPYPVANLYRHFNVNVLMLSIGIQQQLVAFSSISSSFLALEFTTNRISQGRFEQRFIRNTGEVIERNTFVVDTKSAVWRWGAVIRLGARGDFSPRWAVEFSIGYAGLNLLGRDPQRGELLTPDPTLEFQERIVGGFSPVLMILYKFL